jgi:magnesium transporter
MKDLILSLIKTDPVDFARLKLLLPDIAPADIAEIFSEISQDDETRIVPVFRLLPKGLASEVFASMDADAQQALVEALSDKEVGDLVNRLFADDAADFLDEAPANVVTRVLAQASTEKRKTINQLLQYPDDSAGSIMTPEFVDLQEGSTVNEAFDVIRRTGPNKETIYTCYVTRPDQMLVGVVSAKTLLLAGPDEHIRDIMDEAPVFVHTTDDQETAASLFKKYDFLAMPVVDKEGRLVGIITVDDIVDVIEEENTEDFEKMGGMAPSDEPYLKTSVWKMARNRIVWLLVLMLSATVTGGIISHFESALAVLPILTAFIPMLMDTGGNAGCQSSTLIIRGQALGEISFGDTLLILWKEIRVGLICGLILAAVNFVRVWFMNGQNLLLSTAVSITLIGVVISAKAIGAMLPIFAKKMHIDPAIMASPLLTTIQDAVSLIIFFNIAKGLFRL